MLEVLFWLVAVCHLHRQVFLVRSEPGVRCNMDCVTHGCRQRVQHHVVCILSGPCFAVQQADSAALEDRELVLETVPRVAFGCQLNDQGVDLGLDGLNRFNTDSSPLQLSMKLYVDIDDGMTYDTIQQWLECILLDPPFPAELFKILLEPWRTAASDNIGPPTFSFQSLWRARVVLLGQDCSEQAALRRSTRWNDLVSDPNISRKPTS